MYNDPDSSFDIVVGILVILFALCAVCWLLWLVLL